jgi:hypothetical protein
MRVKHKDTKKDRLDPYVSLEAWHKLYYPNDRYLNYEFYDVENIVDLYEIDQETGNTTFLKSEFENDAERIVKDNQKKYFYKTVSENKLDEYLMPKNISNQSFSSRLKKLATSIPSLKDIRQYIINSTASKILGNFIFGLLVTIIGGIALLIIWKLYEIQLLSIFKQ